METPQQEWFEWFHWWHGGHIGWIVVIRYWKETNELLKKIWNMLIFWKQEEKDMSISQIVEVMEKAPGLVEQGMKVVSDVKTVLAKFETDPDAQKTLADVLALEGQIRAIIQK